MHSSPIALEVVTEPDAATVGVVRVKLNPDLVALDDLLVVGSHVNQDGQQRLVEPSVESEQSLLFELPAAAGQTELSLIASLRSPSGRVMRLSPPGIKLGEPWVSPEEEQSSAITEDDIVDDVVDDQTSFDMKQAAIVIGGSNLGFLVLAGIAWVGLGKPKDPTANNAKDKKAKAKAKAKAKKPAKSEA